MRLMVFIIKAILAILAIAFVWRSAPKWLRAVFFVNLTLVVAGHVALRVAAYALGATKTGRNPGMLSDYAFPLALTMLSLYAIVGLAILWALVRVFLGAHRAGVAARSGSSKPK